MTEAPPPIPSAPLPPPCAFDVLGVVTSAGGLEAMSAVLSDLPSDFHAAVVVGQHLGGDSSLVEILGRRVHLPVQWAVDGERLKPGVIHVAPPRMQLEVMPDLTCQLGSTSGDVLKVKPLDLLLRSLADSCGARAMAVVLTGMGTDGAAGARALKQAGGAVLVQDEASAAYPDMPRAAIAAGAADLVLPLGEIGRNVAELVAGERFPVPRNEGEAREALFSGPGPARAALRQVEWAAGALGPVMQWPAAMRAVIASLLVSPMPICTTWGDELVQVYNDAWMALLGDAHADAAGRPARVTWSGPRAQFATACAGVLQSGQALEQRDEPYQPRVGGTPREAYFTLAYSPLADDRGRIAGVLTLATETTAPVLAQRRLQTLRTLTATSAGVEHVTAACERATAVLAQNPRDVPFALVYMADSSGVRVTLCSACGLREGSPAAPHSLDVLQFDAIWPIGRVLRQAVPVHLTELPAAFKGLHAGPWRESPREVLLVPLKVDGDAPLGVLVLGLSARLALDLPYREFLDGVANQVTSNIGEARLRERDRERLAQLSELDRSRTEFFSNVSHEFRTPLTLILAPLEDMLAKPEALQPPLREELALASRNAARLLNLVDTLLDFSQLEAGRINGHFAPCDLSELTRDIAALFRSAVERAGLEFQVDCPAAPAPVPVDRGMWETIVSNLLSNALKFTFQGRITVRLRYLAQHAQLEVIDTGVGIPPAEAPHVLRRFHRVRGTQARSEEGAGIGLAIVDELARLHFGRVRVRSEVGAGSTFTVWVSRKLPASYQASDGPSADLSGAALQLAAEATRWLEEGSTVPAGVRESMLGAGHATPLLARGARVLVADDNADMRDYLARILGGHWHVTLARDGREALELARRHHYDLILADVMMPGLDGFGLLRALRGDDKLKSVPVVLVTARAHEEAAIEGLLAGADDYVAKPFSSRELVARIGAQLELARVRRQGERQVRDLLALMPVGVYAVDLDGRFSYWNRHAAELWGGEPRHDDTAWALLCGPHAARGTVPLAPEDAPLAHALRSGAAIADEELSVVRVDGGVVEVLLNVRPLRDAEGALAGAVCAFVDVTARKHAERSLHTLNQELEQRVGERTAALRESEQRLAVAFAALPFGIGIVDKDGTTVALNDVMRRFLPTGRIPSRDPDRVARWRGWNAAGEPVQPTDFPAARALRGENVLSGMQMLYRDDDGDEAWTEVRAGPLRDHTGRIAGALLVVIDIDRQKRSEEAARQSARRQAFLLDLADALRAERDADAMTQCVLRMLSDELRLDRCGVVALRPRQERADVTHQVGNDALPPLPATARLADYPAALRATSERTVALEDVAEAALPGTRALVAVALPPGAQGPAGWLVALGAAPRHWTRDEIALAEEAVERAWTAIERARAEATATQAERRAESILEHMGDAHSVLDREFRIRGVNAAAERLLGVNRAELLGRSHWQAFPASEDAPVGRALRRVVTDGIEQHLTHHYTGEGYDLHLEVDAYPTEDGGVAMFWRDVTERVRAETALRTSEEKYRALFNQMDEAYAVVEVMADAAGRWTDFLFLEVNPAFMRHTGMPYPVGRTATQLLGTPNPRWAELYGRAAETGESIRLEEAELTLGRVFDLNIFRLGGPGSLRVAVLFTDITERTRAQAALQESERRYRLLFANMSEGFALAALIRDADGRPIDWRYLEVNDAWAQTGVLPAVTVGRTAREVNPAIEPYWLETYAKVVETGQPVNFEAWAGGFGRWFDTLAFKHSENCFGLLFRDVTARHEGDAALRDVEQRYRALVETMAQGYCELELVRDGAGRVSDLRCVACNAAFERLFGVAAGCARGQLVGAVLPELGAGWFDACERVARGGLAERIELEVVGVGRRLVARVSGIDGGRVLVLWEDGC